MAGKSKDQCTRSWVQGQRAQGAGESGRAVAKGWQAVEAGQCGGKTRLGWLNEKAMAARRR